MSEHQLTSSTKGQDLRREELAAKIAQQRTKIRELESKTTQRRHNEEQASLRSKAAVEAQNALEAEARRLEILSRSRSRAGIPKQMLGNDDSPEATNSETLVRKPHLFTLPCKPSV